MSQLSLINNIWSLRSMLFVLVIGRFRIFTRSFILFGVFLNEFFDETEKLREGLLFFFSFHELGEKLVIDEFLSVLFNLEFTELCFHVALALKEHLELAAGLSELNQDCFHLVLY